MHLDYRDGTTKNREMMSGSAERQRRTPKPESRHSEEITLEIEMNLLRDLGTLVRHSLARAGYDVSPIETDDHRLALVTWNKVNRYAIKPLPRQVLKARGFNPQGHEVGIALLENAIRNGDPLQRHMTKRVADIVARDGLLDHWDVHHLHLGTEIDQKSGLIKRTNHILLCRFDDERAYFIMVTPHGARTPNTWYQQEILEIIHNNWPESIGSARVPGVSKVSPNFDDDGIKKLRQVHLNTLLQVSDGTVYAEPGFGTTGDGTNVDDLMRANMVVHAARRTEAHIVDELPQIREYARCQGYHFKSPATFVLQNVRFHNRWHIDYWEILERRTGYWFRCSDADKRDH